MNATIFPNAGPKATIDDGIVIELIERIKEILSWEDAFYFECEVVEVAEAVGCAF